MRTIVMLAVAAALCGCSDDDVDCGALVRQYHAKISAAQVCDTAINTPQCTERSSSYYVCSCNVPLNPATEAFAELKSIAATFAAECGEAACPKDGGACPQGGQGYCTPGGGCMDQAPP